MDSNQLKEECNCEHCMNKKRQIELCFFCYETELDFCNNNNISFKKILDDRFETLNLLKLV